MEYATVEKVHILIYRIVLMGIQYRKNNTF
jgi:hypothetical protein